MLLDKLNVLSWWFQRWNYNEFMSPQSNSINGVVTSQFLYRSFVFEFLRNAWLLSFGKICTDIYDEIPAIIHTQCSFPKWFAHIKHSAQTRVSRHTSEHHCLVANMEEFLWNPKSDDWLLWLFAVSTVIHIF